MKSIRVFYSDLSGKFYATNAYKEVRPGIVEVTGQKFDVTQDIARIIVEKNVTFTERIDQENCAKNSADPGLGTEITACP